MPNTLAVFFDLVGTLIHPTRPIGEQYAAWARRHGAAEADPERMGRAFRAAMRSAPPMSFSGLRGEAVARTERDWWRELVKAVLGDSGPSCLLGKDRFDPFFADLYDHFTTAEAWELYSDVPGCLAELRRRAVVVGLITNYDTRVYPVLDALGVSAALESVTIPALAGAAKPDPAIFRYALAHHGIEPSRAVYVGDEVGDDYEGAAGAGMKAILIDREGRYGAKGLRRIGDLAQLLSFLDSAI